MTALIDYLSKKSAVDAQGVTYLMGTILQADENDKVTLKISEHPSVEPLEEVSVLGSYVPEVGHNVMVMMIGDSPVIMGAINPVDSPGPGRVSDLTVTPAVGALVISWTPLTNASMRANRGSYQVMVDTSEGFDSPNCEVFSTATTRHTISGLGANQNYWVCVRPIDHSNNAGEWSDAVCASPERIDVHQVVPRVGIWPVEALPLLPDDLYPMGTIVYLVQEGKLYRNVADVWTVAVDGNDITARTITGDRLVVGAITAAEIDVWEMEIGQYISGNYVAGTSGFYIGADGHIECNDILVRGKVVASQVTTQEGPNLLTNGEFETNILHWAGVNMTLAQDATQHHGGAKSLKATSTALNQNCYVWSDEFAVVGGQNYSARAWVKAVVPVHGYVDIQIEFYNAQHVKVSSNSAYINGEPNWTPYALTDRWMCASVSSIAHSQAVTCRVGIEFQGAALISIGDAWYIDTVSCVAISNMVGPMKTAISGPRITADLQSSEPTIYLIDGSEPPWPAHIVAGMQTEDDPLGSAEIPLLLIRSPGFVDQLEVATLEMRSKDTINNVESNISAKAHAFYVRDFTTAGGVVYPKAGYMSYMYKLSPFTALLDERTVRGVDATYTYPGAGNNNFADVDATNLVLGWANAFYYPGSGEVWVELEATVQVASATRMQWALRDRVSNVVVPNSEATVLAIPGGLIRVKYQAKITGLTPGDSPSGWKWCWRSTTANVTLTMAHGATYGSAEMRAFAVLG